MAQGGMALTPDGELMVIGIDQLSALDGNGLKLTDDAGTLGISIADGGEVTIGSVPAALIGGTPTTQDQYVRIGAGRTGNGTSYLDLIGDATYSTYGARFLRGPTGANAETQLYIRGTGGFRMGIIEAGVINIVTTNTNRLHISAAGLVGINETANANMTLGLTINQGANDDDIFALKSSDVGHSYTDIAEADTFLYIRKAEATAGGVVMVGFKDADGGAYAAFQIAGALSENVDTTKSSAGRALTEIYGCQSSGGSIANVVANGNVLAVRGRVGAADVALFIVDEDGDTWQSGGITATYGTFSGKGQFDVIGIDAAQDKGYLHIQPPTTGSIQQVIVMEGTLSAVNAGRSIDWIHANDVVYASIAGVTDASGARGELIFYTSDSVAANTAVETMRVDGLGTVFIRESLNANMTIGLTINQGANDDHILAFKSSDVAHGITSWAETDTYGAFMKDHATNAGLEIIGLSSASIAIQIWAGYTTAATGFSSGAAAAVQIQAGEKSNSSLTTMSANANILAIKNYGGCVWICDEDGDTWQSGNIQAQKIATQGAAHNYPIVSYLASSGANYLQVGNSTTGIGASDGFRVGYDGSEVAYVWSSHESLMYFATNGTARMVLDGSKNVLYIGGDTANANMGRGLTINQYANDDEILAFKSSDVAHAWVATTETDTYAYMAKAAAAYGGLGILGIAHDHASAVNSMVFYAYGGQANTTKGAASTGLVTWYIAEHNGSNAIADVTADGNIVAIKAYVSSAWATRWQLDEDGDTWQSGSISLGSANTVAWGDLGEYIYGDNADSSITCRAGGYNFFWKVGQFFINDTVNTKGSRGITINQGAQDDEVLAFKSSDVAHGMTTFAETDTYCTFQKLHVTSGGLDLRGWSGGTLGILLAGYVTTAITTKSAAGDAAVILEGALKSGTGLTALGGDANIVCIRNNGTTVWIADADGDTWQNGTVTAQSLVFNDGGSKVDIVRDEDDMASDDLAALATQQSIKKYVDDNVGGGGGKLELIEKIVCAGQSTLDFEGISGYNKIMVHFENVVPSVDGRDFHMRVYAGSWLTSSIYSSAEFIVTNAGGTGTWSQTNDTELDVSGYSSIGSAANENGVSGEMGIYGFDSGSMYKSLFANLLCIRADNYMHRSLKGAHIKTTTALTGLRFYFNTGLLESGSITVYGIADS